MPIDLAIAWGMLVVFLGLFAWAVVGRIKASRPVQIEKFDDAFLLNLEREIQQLSLANNVDPLASDPLVLNIERIRKQGPVMYH